MITIRRRAVFLVLAALAAASGQVTLAEARPNPYAPIVERNAFGLKPPPPPVVETNQPAPASPVKVILTGITSMFGPGSERAFLEITEGEPGKQTGSPKRPMLGEGDREGGVEVVSIDIQRNIVKIRNGFVESELTFEVPKPTSTGGVPPPTGKPVANTASAPSPSQPTIISSSESRGGITMLGGGGGFAGNASGVTSYGANTPASTGNSGGISSYGAIQPMGTLGFGGPSGGLAGIPSRTLRTPTTTQHPPVDPEQQQILMELNRINDEKPRVNPRTGKPVITPPLPPTAVGRYLNGSGPPAPPGVPGF